MTERKPGQTAYLFVTVGSRTARGGRVTRVSTKLEYKGMALARLGDIVTYDDGSEATITDGAGFGAAWKDKPLALVGSHLSNGDTISRRPACSIRTMCCLRSNLRAMSATNMRKALIVQGNPTSTGGVVIGGSAYGMTDNGRTFALWGDEATCGTCKGAFKIAGTATQRCYESRAGVVEGDWVLCPCGRNRVIAGPNPGCFYYTDDNATSATSATSPAEVSSSSVPAASVKQSATHAWWCYVTDSVTGRPLPHREYIAHVGDTTQSGKTDSGGYAKIETADEQPLNIHFLFSSPNRTLKPRSGTSRGSRLRY